MTTGSFWCWTTAWLTVPRKNSVASWEAEGGALKLQSACLRSLTGKGRRQAGDPCLSSKTGAYIRLQEPGREQDGMEARAHVCRNSQASSGIRAPGASAWSLACPWRAPNSTQAANSAECMLLSSLPARLTSATVFHCHLGSGLRSRDQCVPRMLLVHIYDISTSMSALSLALVAKSETLQS